MKRFVVVVWILLATIAGGASAQDIYSLIQTGRLEEAREALGERTEQIRSDGDLMFFAALLEPEADSAARLLEAALANKAQERFVEQCYLNLANITLLLGQYDKTIVWPTDYAKRYPTGEYGPELTRLQALAYSQSNRPDQALEIIDRLLKRKLEPREMQQGLLDKAKLLAAMGKPVGAASILNRITKEADGEALPPALDMLANTSLQSGKTEEAGRYYALLFEGFPLAVGLASLESQISAAPPPATRSDQAEQITATFYSVKVGVFSAADNARAQAALFKDGRPPVEILQRTIKGKVYHVVYVGRLQSYDAASQLRATLQQQTGEQYEVVTR